MNKGIPAGPWIVQEEDSVPGYNYAVVQDAGEVIDGELQTCPLAVAESREVAEAIAKLPELLERKE